MGEKKDIEEVQEILEEKDIGDNGDSDGLFVDTSNDASKAWQEAKEEMLEKVEESTMDQVEVEESLWTRPFPAMHLFFSQKQQCKHLKASRKSVKPKKRWLRRWVRSRMTWKTNNVLWKRRRRVWRKKTMVRM